MAAPRGRGWLYLGMLALCHGLSDFYATAYIPLVETFRDRFDLDKAGIAVIGAVVGVFGSMMQPLFGIWSDRAKRGLMAAVGLAASAVFVSLIGLSPSVWALGALLTLGALGVAAFHPSGAVLATRGTRQRSVAMGYFLSGGGVGLALAPVAVAGVVTRWGQAHLWVLCVPGLAFAFWVWAASRGEERSAPSGRAFDPRALFAPGTGPLWALFAMATLRSTVITVFMFFVSVVGAARGWDVAASGRAATLFLGCSVVGSLCGGHLAQWRDPRTLLGASCVLGAPFFYGFAALRGWPGVAAFAGAGLVFGVANPVNVSFAQELRPRSASMVSGLMMGLAWGVASLVLVPVGALADRIGIEPALQLVALLGAAAGACALFLPSRRDLRAGAGG